MQSFKIFFGLRIVINFLSIFALKIMKIALLPMLTPLLKLKSHKLVFLKILYGIGDRLKHYLWSARSITKTILAQLL